MKTWPLLSHILGLNPSPASLPTARAASTGRAEPGWGHAARSRKGCWFRDPQSEGDAHEVRYRTPAPVPLGTPSTPKPAAMAPQEQKQREKHLSLKTAILGSSPRPRQWQPVPQHHQAPACCPSAVTLRPFSDSELCWTTPSPGAGDPPPCFLRGYLAFSSLVMHCIG